MNYQGMSLTSSRDNWERLVAAVVKRQQIWELCHQLSISSDDLSDQTLSFSSSNSEPENSSISQEVEVFSTMLEHRNLLLIGYRAPEYLSTGKISEKTDVYGYGITLLELIAGQRASDLARLANADGVMLLDWVKGLLKQKKLEKFVDPDLHKFCVEAEVVQIIQVALLCTQNSALRRPKMSDVVRLLQGDGLAEKWDEWHNMDEDELPQEKEQMI